MASIRKQGDRFEIRECRSTDRGPRQYTLATFRGVLTPEVLDTAVDNARLPIRREALVARAEAMGIGVSSERRFPEARVLLARLRRGLAIDPSLAKQLRDALGEIRAEPVPEHLLDAAEWIGQSDSDRGRALRGLLRTTDRIVGSRATLRVRPRARYPRFSSVAAASNESGPAR